VANTLRRQTTRRPSGSIVAWQAHFGQPTMWSRCRTPELPGLL